MLPNGNAEQVWVKSKDPRKSTKKEKEKKNEPVTFLTPKKCFLRRYDGLSLLQASNSS